MFSGQKYDRVGDSTTLTAQNLTLVYSTAGSPGQSATTQDKRPETFTSSLTGETPATGPTPEFMDRLDRETKMVYAGPHAFELFSDFDDLVTIRRSMESWFMAFLKLETDDDGVDNTGSVATNIYFYQQLTGFLDGLLQAAAETTRLKDIDRATAASLRKQHTELKAASTSQLETLVETQSRTLDSFERAINSQDEIIKQQAAIIEGLAKKYSPELYSDLLALKEPTEQPAPNDTPTVSEQ